MQHKIKVRYSRNHFDQLRSGYITVEAHSTFELSCLLKMWICKNVQIWIVRAMHLPLVRLEYTEPVIVISFKPQCNQHEIYDKRESILPCKKCKKKNNFNNIYEHFIYAFFGFISLLVMRQQRIVNYATCNVLRASICKWHAPKSMQHFLNCVKSLKHSWHLDSYPACCCCCCWPRSCYRYNWFIKSWPE